LSATRALYRGPEGSGGDVFGCSDTAGTGSLGGLQDGDKHPAYGFSERTARRCPVDDPDDLVPPPVTH